MFYEAKCYNAKLVHTKFFYESKYIKIKTRSIHGPCMACNLKTKPKPIYGTDQKLILLD